MIDEKEIEAYQRIKAPEELRTRVLADCVTKPKTKYWYLKAAVACLPIFLITGILMIYLTTTSIYVDNQKITENELLLSEDSVAATAYRSAEELEEDSVVIHTRCNTNLRISEGNMQIFDMKSHELLYSGKEYSIKGTVAVRIFPDDKEGAILYLENFLCQKEITIKMKRKER